MRSELSCFRNLCGKCGKGRGEEPVPHTVHGLGSAPSARCTVWGCTMCEVCSELDVHVLPVAEVASKVVRIDGHRTVEVWHDLRAQQDEQRFRDVGHL